MTLPLALRTWETDSRPFLGNLGIDLWRRYTLGSASRLYFRNGLVFPTMRARGADATTMVVAHQARLADLALAASHALAYRTGASFLLDLGPWHFHADVGADIFLASAGPGTNAPIGHVQMAFGRWLGPISVMAEFAGAGSARESLVGAQRSAVTGGLTAGAQVGRVDAMMSVIIPLDAETRGKMLAFAFGAALSW
jgi:hypothetical protein